MCYLFAFTMYIGSEIRNLTPKSKILSKCFNVYLYIFLQFYFNRNSE